MDVVDQARERSIIQKSTELHWLRQKIKKRENPSAVRIGFILTDLAERKRRLILERAFNLLWRNRFASEIPLPLASERQRIIPLYSCLKFHLTQRLNWGLRCISKIATVKYEMTTSCQVVKRSGHDREEVLKVYQVYGND